MLSALLLAVLPAGVTVLGEASADDVDALSAGFAALPPKLLPLPGGLLELELHAAERRRVWRMRAAGTRSSRCRTGPRGACSTAGCALSRRS